MSDSFYQKVTADLLRWRPRFTALSFIRLLLMQPGFQLAFSIRLQEQCARIPLFGKLFRRIMWYATTIITGADINPQAQIGGGVFFPHPNGIVIGLTCIVGRNVSIYQNVTLGRRTVEDERTPGIGDDACINAGAVLIGGITIGKSAVIGANAVVLKDVPAGYIAVGVPARVFAPKTAS
jgi:serine O-acetyltransferase